jgi:hypothetical protein
MRFVVYGSSRRERTKSILRKQRLRWDTFV